MKTWMRVMTTMTTRASRRDGGAGKEQFNKRLENGMCVGKTRTGVQQIVE